MHPKGPGGMPEDPHEEQQPPQPLRQRRQWWQPYRDLAAGQPLLLALLTLGLLGSLALLALARTHAAGEPLLAFHTPCMQPVLKLGDPASASRRGPYTALVKSLVQQRGLTMLSRPRLDNVEAVVNRVIDEGTPGDVLECGVWQGGASILMKSVLVARGSDKQLYCADSYQGLPPKNALDEKVDGVKAMDPQGSYNVGGVQAVKDNFKHFELLDESVHFLVGYFNETLPKATAIDQLAVLRMDGDMYSSTMDILNNMYDRVVPGGFVIIDDYGFWPQCKAAVNDYFAARGQLHVLKGITVIDDTGVYFQKPSV